jgi:predicted transposase/invertase (TIGR01784 family)
VIVDIQHRRYNDHYDRFLHYHCAALLEQISTAKSYSPALTVFTIVVSTSGTQEDVAIAEINFDPVELFSRQRLYKIPHRLLYLSPKHWTSAIPEPYQQWLHLIQDSLDEQVDEAIYHKPEIIKALNLIKTDGLTPQDRARMKDEYALEQALKKEKLKEFERGKTEGKLEGKLEGIREMARKLQSQGMTVEVIEQLTGLSRELWL